MKSWNPTNFVHFPRSFEPFLYPKARRCLHRIYYLGMLKYSASTMSLQDSWKFSGSNSFLFRKKSRMYLKRTPSRSMKYLPCSAKHFFVFLWLIPTYSCFLNQLSGSRVIETCHCRAPWNLFKFFWLVTEHMKVWGDPGRAGGLEKHIFKQIIEPILR